MPWKDKEKARIYWMKWYYKNKKYYNKYKNILRYKNTKAKRNWLIKELGNKCKKCGKEYPNVVFDVHHIDGRNKGDTEYLYLESWDNIKRKLPRLMLLCANCHRIEHKK
jgi:predicted HNH restriction endonuclease